MSNTIDSINWHHSIPFGIDEITEGDVPLWGHRRRHPYIPTNLSGKTVLDVGTWDGYFTFLAEARGADHVLAIDPMQHNRGKTGFEYAKERLGSDVKHRVVDVFDIEETFDVVICFGVLYHVENPESLLDHLTELTNETLCLESAVNPSPTGQRRFDTNDGLTGIYGDSTYYVPTAPWIQHELRDRGFNIQDEETHLGCRVLS